MKKGKLIRWKALIAVIALMAVAAGCGASESELGYDNKADVAGVEEQALTEKINNLARPGIVQGAMSICYDIEELKSEKIVEVVRFNDGRYYSVTPVENGKYLFLLYGEPGEDDNSPYVVDGYMTSGFADKDEFKDIRIGMSKETILTKDSNSYEDELITCHRFEDKTVLVIEYDKDANTVSDYYYYPEDRKDDSDWESVVDYLLPEDLELLL